MNDVHDVQNNVLFHFNPRPNNVLVFNSRYSGHWREERKINNTVYLAETYHLSLHVVNPWAVKIGINGDFYDAYGVYEDITKANFIFLSDFIHICESQNW